MSPMMLQIIQNIETVFYIKRKINQQKLIKNQLIKKEAELLFLIIDKHV